MAQKKTAQAAKKTVKASSGKPTRPLSASAKAPAKATKPAPKAATAKAAVTKVNGKKVAAGKPVTAKGAAPKLPAKAAVTKAAVGAAKAVVKPVVSKTAAPAKAAVTVAKPAPPRPAAAVHAAPVAKPMLNPAAQIAAAQARAAAAAQPATQRAVPAVVQKSPGQKITAPVAAAVATTQPATPKAIADKAAAARPMVTAQQKKPVNQRHGFKANEFIVYPSHGVGRIVGIEEQEIAGMTLELFVITFEKEKLTLRVPTGKLQTVGMRKLAEDDVVKKALETLKGRARIKRTMWSRRAQEYVAKINSGDLVAIAEVVRDLYRSEAQPEQSYSERQLYEDALDRMARELAAVEKLDDRGAVQRIVEILSKSAKSRRLAASEAEGDADGDAESDSDVVEAA